MLDLVIPDTGPLITFGLIDRLDLIDRFDCAILVTDMVREEVLRGPETTPDRARFATWFEERGNRIQTIETTYGAMWRELSATARKRIRRLHANAGELSIRELTDTLRTTLPSDDQVLVLFEDESVKRMDFGNHVHLLHTYAFLTALENLSLIGSAEEIRASLLAKGRNLAQDLYERRATVERTTADWQADYDRSDLTSARRGRADGME